MHGCQTTHFCPVGIEGVKRYPPFGMESAMTTEQKSQIDQYRQSGMRYSEIARRMGLLETTVRSYCYRKPAPSVVDAPATSVCPQCGKALPTSKYRPRRFCSDRCRNKYWLTHMDNSSNSSAEKLTCQYCGKPFVDYKRHHRKYCSHPCFIAARYGGERHG